MKYYSRYHKNYSEIESSSSALFDNQFLLVVIGILILQKFMDHSWVNSSFDKKEIHKIYQLVERFALTITQNV